MTAPSGILRPGRVDFAADVWEGMTPAMIADLDAGGCADQIVCDGWMRRWRRRAAPYVGLDSAELGRLIAEQIQRLGQQPPMPPREFVFNTTKLTAMRSAAAPAFGEERGWTLSASYVSLGGLMEGKRHITSRSRWCWRPRGWEVAAEYSYHRDHRAAAIALHLRDLPAVEPGWRRVATLGLTLELPDYPAWHSPADCTLVILLGPIGRQKRKADGLSAEILGNSPQDRD